MEVYRTFTLVEKNTIIFMATLLAVFIKAIEAQVIMLGLSCIYY